MSGEKESVRFTPVGGLADTLVRSGAPGDQR